MNVFDNLPEDTSKEVIEVLLSTPGLTIERIVSHGECSPPGFWYDQDDREWVVLLKGRAKLSFADEDVALMLTPGDYVDILPHRRHRVEWTDPETETLWLAVHW